MTGKLFLESIESFKYSFLILHFELDISMRVEIVIVWRIMLLLKQFPSFTKVSERIVPTEVQ